MPTREPTFTPPITSPKSELLEASRHFEAARLRWLRDPYQYADLAEMQRQLATIRHQLNMTEDPGAKKQAKRWLKVQQKLSALLSWLDLLNTLQHDEIKPIEDSFSKALHQLTKPFIKNVLKLLDPSEWSRIRHWWLSYLDSLAGDMSSSPFLVTRYNRGQHRVSKMRKRVLKSDLHSDWEKLEEALGEYRVSIRYVWPNPIALESETQHMAALEHHLSKVRRAFNRAALLQKLQSNSAPSALLSSQALMAELRLKEKIRITREKEVVRKMLLNTDFAEHENPTD